MNLKRKKIKSSRLKRCLFRVRASLLLAIRPGTKHQDLELVKSKHIYIIIFSITDMQKFKPVSELDASLARSKKKLDTEADMEVVR